MDPFPTTPQKSIAAENMQKHNFPPDKSLQKTKATFSAIYKKKKWWAKEVSGRFGEYKLEAMENLMLSKKCLKLCTYCST